MRKKLTDGYYWVRQRPTLRSNGGEERPHWEPMLCDGGRFYHRGLPDDHPGIHPSELAAVGRPIAPPMSGSRTVKLYAPTSLVDGRLDIGSMTPPIGPDGKPMLYTLSRKRSLIEAYRHPVQVTVTWGGDATCEKAKAAHLADAESVKRRAERCAQATERQRRRVELKAARLAKRLARGRARMDALRAAANIARVTCDRLCISGRDAMQVRRWLAAELGGTWRQLSRADSGVGRIVWRCDSRPGYSVVKTHRPNYDGPALRGPVGEMLPYGYSLYRFEACVRHLIPAVPQCKHW